MDQLICPACGKRCFTSDRRDVVPCPYCGTLVGGLKEEESPAPPQNEAPGTPENHSC